MGPWKNLANDFLLGYLYEFRGIKDPHMVVAPKSTIGNWMNEKECLVAVFDLGGVFTRLIGKPAAFSITILSL